jgi:predicted membrane GTPase involved in stress response
MLLDGVVLRALTERNFESARDLTRMKIADLRVGPLEVVYLDKPFPQEPFYRVAVSTPAAYVGDIIGHLNSRKACIESLHNDGDAVSIKCGVPIASMLGYDSVVSKMTNGRGSADYAFIGYHPRIWYPEPPLPPAVAARA